MYVCIIIAAGTTKQRRESAIRNGATRRFENYVLRVIGVNAYVCMYACMHSRIIWDPSKRSYNLLMHNRAHGGRLGGEERAGKTSSVSFRRVSVYR